MQRIFLKRRVINIKNVNMALVFDAARVLSELHSVSIGIPFLILCEKFSFLLSGGGLQNVKGVD